MEEEVCFFYNFSELIRHVECSNVVPTDKREGGRLHIQKQDQAEEPIMKLPCIPVNISLKKKV